MSAPATLEEALAWLHEQASRLDFGKCSIELVAHAGKITRVISAVEVSSSVPTDTRGLRHDSADR